MSVMDIGIAIAWIASGALAWWLVMRERDEVTLLDASMFVVCMAAGAAMLLAVLVTDGGEIVLWRRKP